MIKKVNKKKFYFVDFGIVGFYSYPYFLKFSQKKAFDYSSNPFLVLKKNNLPDLILVDGRYRVLVGLFTYKYFLNNTKNFTIIFDDYFEPRTSKINRDHYSILSEFFYIRKIGRFGVASKIKQKSKKFLKTKINKYLLDPR